MMQAAKLTMRSSEVACAKANAGVVSQPGIGRTGRTVLL